MSVSDEFDPYLAWLEIRPSEHPISHYRLLGLKLFEADSERISFAADERMRQVRRFQTGPRGRFTQALLNEISAAKLCLLDPNTKQAYDAVLEGQLASSPVPVGEPPVSQAASLLLPPSAAASPPRSALPADAVVPPPVSEPPVRSEAEVTPPAMTVTLPTFKESEPPTAPKWLRLAIALGACVLIGLLVWIVVVVTSGSTKDEVSESPSQNGNDVRSDQPEPKPKQSPAEETETVVYQEATGILNFVPSTAVSHGEDLEVNFSKGVASNWRTTDDYLTWQFEVNKVGIFVAKVTYSADADAEGSRFALTIGRDEWVGDVRMSEKPGDYVTDEVYIVVKKRGRNRLRLRAKEISGDSLFIFKSIQLLPN